VEAGAALPDRRSRKVRLDRFVPLPPELQPFGTVRNRDVTRDEFQSEFTPLFDRIENELTRRRLFPDTNEVARFRQRSMLLLRMVAARAATDGAGAAAVAAKRD
jgi:hypothetical protein